MTGKYVRRRQQYVPKRRVLPTPYQQPHPRLRQSGDEHKKLAEEVGIPLDSGPGAARAAFPQVDSATLSDRGVIIAGNPASCIKTYQMYEDIGVDQVMMIMPTEPIPHDKVMGFIEKLGKEVIPAFQDAKARWSLRPRSRSTRQTMAFALLRLSAFVSLGRKMRSPGF
ncbi:MAG: hypothetical protein O7G88_18415 [bacterium]|nr:hypothetical protein [bacterium]